MPIAMFVAHAAPATPSPRPGSENRRRFTRSKMKSGSSTRFATAPATMHRMAETGEPLQCENALLSEKLIVEPTNCMRNGERPIASTSVTPPPAIRCRIGSRKTKSAGATVAPSRSLSATHWPSARSARAWFFSPSEIEMIVPEPTPMSGPKAPITIMIGNVIARPAIASRPQPLPM